MEKENDENVVVLSALDSLALADSYCVDEEYELAIDAYAAAAVLSSSSSSSVRFRALSHKAAALLKLQRYEQASEDAQAALTMTGGGGLRPGETEACHFRLGLAWFRMQRYEDALRTFQQAKQLAELNHRKTETYTRHIQLCQTELEQPIIEEQEPAAAPPATAPPATAPPKKTAPKPTPTAATPTTTTTKSKLPTMPKYQYYQSDSVMTIAILEADVKREDLRVDFGPKKLTVVLTKQGTNFTVVHGTLYAKVEVSRCKVLVKDEKVLIKLRKVEAHEWHELFGKDDDDHDNETTSEEVTTPPVLDPTKTRAYASHRDWDAIERNLSREDEKPEGDEALNKLFRDIYGRADEDTRRAMIKSYQTSGGTVLSTNWGEVKDKNYEKDRTAPKGMEWKTWEGDKVEQSE